jgi:hypothetical protein
MNTPTFPKAEVAALSPESTPKPAASTIIFIFVRQENDSKFLQRYFRHLRKAIT